MTSLKRIREEEYLDKEWDWRKFGVLKDDPPEQKNGTCWAYSVAAAVQGNLKVCGSDEKKPSVQELIDCCRVQSTIDGGNPVSAFKHIKLRGITTSTEYPTSLSFQGPCMRCHEKMLAAVKIKDYTVIKDITVSSLMEAVTKTPVVVCFLATDHMLEEVGYKKADIFTGGGSYPLDINAEGVYGHCVVVVGYDTKKGGYRGVPDMGYWIMRNSYGKDWGDNGHMKMDRDLTRYFRLAVYPEGAYPVTQTISEIGSSSASQTMSEIGSSSA